MSCWGPRGIDHSRLVCYLDEQITDLYKTRIPVTTNLYTERGNSIFVGLNGI